MGVEINIALSKTKSREIKVSSPTIIAMNNR